MKTPFTTIRSEGGLLPTDLLARVARLDTSLPGIDPASYWLDPGDRIAEAIARSWTRLLGAWQTFSRHRADAKPDDPIVGLTRDRWLYPLLDALGWGRPVRAEETTHERGAVPIHLMGANVPLDRRTANVPGAAKHAPHTVVQDLLNRSDARLWGIVSNGLQLRLLRDNTSMTRQAFVEFDLEAMFDGEVYADFVVCWLVCHCSRFDAERPEAYFTERWTLEAQTSGVRALAQLRSGVEQTLVALGNGFLQHRANTALRERLASHELTTNDLYRQLLRLVYRLIFLCCAEDRGLLHDPGASPLARETYAAHYSTARLRGRARRRGTDHTDLWHALRIVMRGLRDGCPPLGLPALGSMLWSDTALPDLDSAVIANSHLLAAVRSLAYTIEGRTLRAVDWRNLGSEELGSVYESLLELHPSLPDATTFTLDTAAGHERKVTGSYYTPTSLITELHDSALDPVLDERTTPEAILAVKVCDPACGSGHFLIAAAHRIARRLAVARTGEPEPAPDATRSALRDVIGHCIYGVDVNQMAVELCKVSLWLEALEPGKPLSFLDHRIACGNSLLGTTPRLIADGIPDDAYKPITGDAKDIAAAWRKRNAAERKGQQTFGFGSSEQNEAWLAAEIAAIEAVDDSTPDGIREKERRWTALQASRQAVAAKLVADAWCAGFVMPLVKDVPVVTTGTVRQMQTDHDRTDARTREAVAEVAERYRFLHWQLAFPDVFTTPADPDEAENAAAGWDGGFDVVCGNPPWEMTQLEEKQYFAVRHPEIAVLAGAKRKKAIEQLATHDPELYADYQAELRRADGESKLLRASGRYPLCGRGRTNTYAVFAETMRNLVAPAGRAGIIVPSGIATDDTTKYFFRDIVERGSLVSLFDFENRLGLFPSVDSRVKFCLLTLSGPTRPPGAAAEFVFFAHATADLTDPERRFTLTPDDLALLNPNTRTCPVFRTRRDAQLTKAIYRRVPVLIEEGPPERNPWGIRFKQGLFNMTSDSHLFRTAAELEALGAKLDGNVYRHPDGRVWLPLYEAKMIHHYDHRWATYDGDSIRDVTPEEKRDPNFVVLPRYWVSDREVGEELAGWSQPWLLGFRDICRSTDERTVIASLVPVSAISNKLPLLMTDKNLLLLAANLSAFVLDYVGRQKQGSTSLNFFIAQQHPVLPPERYDMACPWDVDVRLRDWITSRVAQLTSTAIDLEVRDELAPWDDLRRAHLRAELDACFFHLYGLTRDEVDYVMDTFPIVCRKDEAAQGEIRTKRLILAAYDDFTGRSGGARADQRAGVDR